MSSKQLTFAVGTSQNRNLFPRHFLEDRLADWPEYSQLDASGLLEELTAVWDRERDLLPTFNEEQTEDRFIRPILGALGFQYTARPRLSVAGRRREPDYALFISERARRESEGSQGQARYAQAAALLEAKRFDRPLDRRRAAGNLSEDPVAQIIYYVSTTHVPFGILTNGRIWRLYAQLGDLVEGAYYEVDLVALLEAGDARALRNFAAFFSASAFEPDENGRSFLDRALEESRANAIEVGDALQRQVFAAVPNIAQGLLGEDPPTEKNLDAAFEHSLVFLYRLLFCLHAEARRLLPIDSPHYLEYSVRRQRRELAEAVERGRVYSHGSDRLYNELEALFKLVAAGDTHLGVNEYNGDLFSASKHPWLKDRVVPDALLAPALDGLYRLYGQTIDYRDLSVRQLGTIYERLLEYRLTPEGDGLELVHATGRRDTGSYFTPEPIVDLIVERTLEPALERRSAAVAKRRLKGKRALDAFLELRVVDPAMGSGHFLVSAASYIAKFIATDPSYDGPLDWQQIERLVAERCIYGVDLNPMAVELAKLALWLSTVRSNVPLTFLSNLRSGNSLVGADLDHLEAGQVTVFSERLAQDAESLLTRTAEVAELESDSGSHVHQKERLAERAELLRHPLHEYADRAIADYFQDPTPMFHWEIEFPEVFLSADGKLRSDGGFDAVIGNPPYIRIQSLGRDLANWCRRRYEVAFGSFDAYLVFIERAVGLLGSGGRLGFIVPNKFMKLDSAKKLRACLAEGQQVEELIDFGDAQLFEGATNYTSILILDCNGQGQFVYRKVSEPAEGIPVPRGVEEAEAETFNTGDLGSDPWVLVAGEVKRLLDAIRRNSVPLGEVTRQIFQGLITGADQVYLLEDRGSSSEGQVVYSKASEHELILEPDLLHRLASGADVGRYAFSGTSSLILFPYQVTGGMASLMSETELGEFPRTEQYLREHEAVLRGRERGAMDTPQWYAFGRTQNLGIQDQPKLGIPRLCEHLRASADLDGVVYLDNVDVNGLLTADDGPSLWTILCLLNSQLLDFVFRLSSVPFRGNFYSANRQFIAPLPVRIPDSRVAADLERWGRKLHALAVESHTERSAFQGWLADVIGAPLGALDGHTKLTRPEDLQPGELTAILASNRDSLAIDPQGRSFHGLLRAEHASYAEKVRDLKTALTAGEEAVDEIVFDLYEVASFKPAIRS
ncbi:MAG TPA: N-6 DNA methylase [Solirubrobacterales bacterium]|nr:N-6 DNA methylase [Solirubrobacterales bacterium]